MDRSWHLQSVVNTNSHMFPNIMMALTKKVGAVVQKRQTLQANKRSTKGRSFNVKTINAHKRGTRKEIKKRNSIDSIRTSHTILL
jgi:hypothetical protein